MNREPGFYWVKYKNKWTISRLTYIENISYWYLINFIGPIYTEQLQEIDERRIEREPEKKPPVYAYWDENTSIA
jgi:hypothetical protein